MKRVFSLLAPFMAIVAANYTHEIPPNPQNVSAPKDTVSQPKAGNPGQQTTTGSSVLYYDPLPGPVSQISQYIRRMFQDRNGNIWFGTNGDGLARYDARLNDSVRLGKPLVYFTVNEGFSGRAVRGIVEDPNGNLWFATDAGVSRYDGQTFKTFDSRNGLGSNQVWSILIDKSGTVWCGTEAGVYRSDGKNYTNGLPVFTLFPLPEADLSNKPDAYPAPKLVNSIYQDKAGNIWFGTNGLGVYRYSGTSSSDGKPRLTNFSEKDGLCNNFVQCIVQDDSKGEHKGELWFGTRFGGMSRFDGVRFTNFTTKDGLSSNFVWTFLQDNSGDNPDGDLWIGSAGGGLMLYDGKTFRHFTEVQGLSNRHVQSLLKDSKGRLWVGTSGGAFRFDGKAFINVTKNGPW
jgi:ligand-binding sensor domain-containing protein